MNNGLLYFGALLVVVLAALFAVPNFIDWNGYRGVFEEEASKVLGRDVRVGGSVNLKLLPVPYVRFEKVRIADPTGQTGESFVRAESFTMWLSGPALLRGVLEASEVELNKPVLTLAVDSNGSGNWSNIELRPGDLPFVPHDVALRSVKLIDGAISIYNAATERIALLEGIYGEFSADGLKGPFRFKGLASWTGTAHDIKFATDAPSADGSFPLKISARADRSPNVYLLDGRVSNLSQKPTFTGDWTGKLAVPGSDASADDSTDAPLLDLRSTVTADALGAKFDDLTLSVDNAAEPQTVSGSATATWAAEPRFDAALASKWLDIDWLAGAGQGSASFPKLKQLAIGLMQSVAGDSTAAAKINLEQVKIGGETAGGLRIDADRHDNATHFKTFKVSLPGGSRLDLNGDLKNDAGKMSFSGNVFIAGSSLSRLRTWAGKSGMPIDIKAEGAFSAGGKLDIDDTRFALTDGSGDVSGRALAGDVTITHDGGRERTEATLQAADLDTREVFPVTSAALNAELHKALGLQPVDDTSKTAAALPGDMRLRIIAGSLLNGDETYRDVDVTFELEGSEIRLPAAKLTTANGLTIGLEGRVKTGTGSPVGTLAYDLVGPTPDAIKDLAHKTGLEAVFGGERLNGLKEGKIAGLLQLGLRAPQTTDVTFDGTLNGAHANGSAEFDGGLGAWRSRPSRIQATFDAPSVPALIAALGRDVEANAGSGSASAKVVVIANGVVGSGAMTRVEIAAPGLALTYAGTFALPEDQAVALDGALDVKADDVSNALALLGLPLPSGASGVTTHGTLAVARAKGTWTVAARDLSLGASVLSGNVKVAATSTGGERIEGKVDANRVSVTGLLSALSDRPAATLAAAGPPPAPDTAATAKVGANTVNAAAPETRSIWPDGLFNFAALGNTEVDVELGFGSLDLSGNLATRSGALKLSLAPGKVTVSDFAAEAVGGKISGRLALEKAPDGVALTTKLRLADAKLSALSPAAAGNATFDIDANARAQSPAGLIAVLAGTGSVKLDRAVLPGPDAGVAAGIVDTVLHGKLQNDPRTISAALLTALDTSKTRIGERQLALTIADGSVKFDSLALESPDGKVEATLTSDLTSLGLNAACQVTALIKPLPPPPIPLPDYAPPAPKGPLPPAIVLYSGRLDNLTTVKPSVDAADLQRELTVRQMERNVEELEQSRKVDEERARLEKERRAALEDQRAAAVAAARAKKDTDVMPPVIPESAGTSPAPDSALQPDANPAVPPPAPVASPAAPTASQPPVAEQPPVQAAQPPDQKPADAGASTDATGGNTVLTPKISIEPIPPPPGETSPGSTPGAVTTAIDPATGLPIAPNAAAARPATRSRPEPSRTSSDEVLKSLGGFP